MKTTKHSTILLAGMVLFFSMSLWSCNPASEDPESSFTADPLPSWNDGSTKQAIVDFVSATTDPANDSFIPENERIAVFDNDGTLWSEQPYYFQFQFAMDRIRDLAPEHPEWKNEQPFKAVLENDMETVKASGVNGLIQLVMATHAGMDTEEFHSIVIEWIKTARHPGTGKLFTEMVYQPMLELLEYFRANGFQTWIVSGGGIEFIRPLSEGVYGIPPEQVIGSSVELQFEMVDGNPAIQRLGEIHFINDKEGKPVGIERHIGKKPVAAFGNSDGDLAMLSWTASGEGKRLMVYIHHTDEEREWAYDRDSHIGKLDKGLEEATSRGWTVVDMKNDWKVVFTDTRH